MLAAAVTFPLSFGWIRFETPSDSLADYDAFVGVPLFRFSLASPLAPLVFNVLDIAAFLVIAGVGLALLRRTRDRGAIAVRDVVKRLSAQHDALPEGPRLGDRAGVSIGSPMARR